MSLQLYNSVGFCSPTINQASDNSLLSYPFLYTQASKYGSFILKFSRTLFLTDINSANLGSSSLKTLLKSLLAD